MKDRWRVAYLRTNLSSRNMSQTAANRTTDSVTFIAKLSSRPDFYFYYDFVSWSRAMVSVYKNHGALGKMEERASKRSIEKFAEIFGISDYRAGMRLTHDFGRDETQMYVESSSRPGSFHLVSIPFVKRGGDKRSILWKSYHCGRTCERWSYSNMKNDERGSNGIYGDFHMISSMLLAANKMGADGFNVFEEDSEMTRKLAASIEYIGKTYEESRPYKNVNENFVKKNAIFMKMELERKFLAPPLY